jgi:hypothetical protein
MMAIGLGELSWLQRKHESWSSPLANATKPGRGYLLARAHVGPDHIHLKFHGGL